MTKAWFIWLAIFFSTITLAQAQLGNTRCKWIYIKSGTFELDSLSVFPNSIRINYPKDTSVKIKYDINSNTATLIGESDSIHVCYSVLPYKLNRSYYKRNAATFDSNAVYKEDYGYRRFVSDKKEELFSSPGINKTGNISRGISFGNNQNVFVNSVLNLQLEGRLTDDVTITAVISDQNIPFQPDGNTQQIQEFDKVFVKLQSKRASLTAGDVVMRSRPSNFLKYYRNVQGAQAEWYSKGKDSTIKSVTTAGIAISKGKFNSMQFGFGLPDSISEGVQGPYRLRGPNNERFIIVLANSEKVYLDGRLLKRGWDYDYIIDYNQAEITFTNNVLITRFSRVRVDFEFSDRNYGRTIINASHYQDYKNAKAFISYYQERDNPDNPLTLQLTEADKQALSLIGDTLNKAVVSGESIVAYTNNRILYKKITQNGEQIYVRSTNADSAIYDVRFTQVAPTTGRYILDNSQVVNGSVYRYVGLPNGNYEPVQIIPTPKRKQMIAVGGSIDATKQDVFYGEAAFSVNDINLFSSFDDGDDQGYSYKVGYNNNGRKVHFLKDYKWLAGANYEFNSKNFTAIDRFRDADFERDWSENVLKIADNNILNLTTGFVKNEKNRINYQYGRREKPGDVSGSQQTLLLNQSIGKFQFLGNGFLMRNDKTIEESDWKRASGNLYYTSKFVVPGVSYSFDHNTVSDSVGNIRRTGMYFDEQKVYIRNNDSLKIKFFVDYARRSDKEPFAGIMQDNSRTETTNAGIGGKLGANHAVNTAFTYRFQNNDRGPTRTQNEETVMGRAEWNADLFKRHVRSELLITSATGRELQRRFVYLPVAPGLGTYVWKDFNGDGILQLNEFVEKIFDDPNGEYIKTFVPTDRYIKAYTNTFNYRIDASTPRAWRSSSNKVKQFFSKFSNVSSWVVNKKLLDKDIASRFIPFYNRVADTSLISFQNSIRSTFFFNRTSSVYGVEASYASIESKQFLAQGFDERKNNDIGLTGRMNIKKFFNIKLTGSQLSRKSTSTYLPDRNFNVSGWKVTPVFSWQPKNTLRFSLNGSYTYKFNDFEKGNNELAQLYEGGAEVKVNKLSRRTITIAVKYINIAANLKGTSPNSPVAYEMFDALQEGRNYTWTAVWQEKLVNGLQLSFNYEGRKIGTTNVVHIGRMQVSALF